MTYVLEGFEGRIAVVTGGGRGIGLEVAEVLHRLGAAVAVVDLNAPVAEAAPDDGADQWRHWSCDITDESAVDAAFSEIESELGSPTILVNSAGILEQQSILDMSLDTWDRVFRANVTGAFLCTRRALPGMIQQGYGRIVSIGSSASKTGGYRHLSAYGASKAALATFGRAVATEYADRGITSNVIAPAAIKTDMIEGMGDFSDRIPVGRMGTVEDVAFFAVAQCSAHAGYMTAEVTDVNGGFLID